MSKYQWEHKLSFVDRRQIMYLYTIGQGISELGRQYNVHHASIWYYVKNLKRGKQSNKKVTTQCEQHSPQHKIKSYSEYLEIENNKNLYKSNHT